MKTDWNKLLAGFRTPGNKERFPEIVTDCINQEAAGKSIQDIMAYVGSTAKPLIRLNEKPGPYRVWAKIVEQETKKQMDTVASLPVFVKGALMSDGHPGYGMPVGGVAGLYDAISPYFVGPDIGCRVSAGFFTVAGGKMTPLMRNAIEEAIVKVSRFGFDHLNETHPLMKAAIWNKISQLKNVKELAESQLGTSGGGNHFIDLMETSLSVAGADANTEMPVYALVLHSGSRGAGKKLADYYFAAARAQCESRNIAMPPKYEYLAYDSQDGREYFTVMNLMLLYSLANHEVIFGRIYNKIEQFVSQQNLFGATRRSVTVNNRKGGPIEISYISNPHNLASIEPVGEQNLVVHRKGATPAGKGVIGIIPGSSGSNSYIVVGKGNSESLNSASHGAGRPFSRKAAAAAHDKSAWEAHMQERDIHYHGVAKDETVFSYKDIEEVMGQQADLVDKLATMKPLFVAMGGHSDDGD